MRVTGCARRASNMGRRLALGSGRDSLEERDIKEHIQTTPKALTSDEGIIAMAGVIVIPKLRGGS